MIAASTATHPELLPLCVRAGVPTFCEKPIAADIGDAVKVLDAVGQSEVPVQIGYPRRFDPAFVAAREAVRSGALGFVHTVRSTTLDPAPPPAAYIAGSGGIFRDCSVHDFDAVRWVSGREVVEVYATGGNQAAEVLGETFIADAGDVDSASTLLTLEGGGVGVVSNTRYNARGYDVRLEVHGSADSVAAGLEAKLPLRSTEPGTTFPDGVPHTFFMDRLAAAFVAELTAFTEVAAGRRPSPCTLADAMQTGWVAEAATLSLAQHRPVTLEEVRSRYA